MEQATMLKKETEGRLSEFEIKLQNQVLELTKKMEGIINQNKETFLSEVTKMKDNIDGVQARINQSQTQLDQLVSPNELENNVSRRISGRETMGSQYLHEAKKMSTIDDKSSISVSISSSNSSQMKINTDNESIIMPYITTNRINENSGKKTQTFGIEKTPP